MGEMALGFSHRPQAIIGTMVLIEMYVNSVRIYENIE